MNLVKQQFSYRDVIGRNIICEDGTSHRVVEIVGSHRFPWKAIINETDPDAQLGYFVNLLSLSCQMLGKPIPSKDQQEAYARMIRAVSFQGQQKPRLRMNEKGLIVPTH